MSAARIFARWFASLMIALGALSAAHAPKSGPPISTSRRPRRDNTTCCGGRRPCRGCRCRSCCRCRRESRNLRQPQMDELTDLRVERRWIDAGPAGLEGKRIDFLGLQLTITDVLVRVERLDGAHSTELVHPSRPYIEIPAPRGAVKTISAFTVAHSITLAAATLGYANIPAPPLNASIALSILFLGPEIVRSWRGETSFTIRCPWVVAFAFGLLHGFGFASGLTAIGLPQGDIPLALLTFNIGVEIGQLAFVAVIFCWSAPLRSSICAGPSGSNGPRPMSWARSAHSARLVHSLGVVFDRAGQFLAQWASGHAHCRSDEQGGITNS